MTSASDLRAEEKKRSRTAQADRNAARDRLRGDRDRALREIGDQLADGKRTLEERAQRARAQVWTEFRKQMEKLK